MMGPAEFRELISGRRRGASAAAMRSVLRLGEIPYTAAVAWRNRRYDRGRNEIQHASVPVISVGNLTLGGTGKTPLVKWLARWLLQRNLRVAIVSRGYGASAGQANDEALELAQSLPEVPHEQNRDRVAAARKAVETYDSQLILLDDGFQHRRLARDLDIVLLDALEPFGFDHVFPRGTLREPVSGLKRAQVVCLSRADTIPAGERAAVRGRVAQVAPHAVWCEMAHTPREFVNANDQSQPLNFLRGRRVAAFCGIGNPAGFRHSLTSARCDVVAWRTFPDHHVYSQAELASIGAMAADAGVDALVCTQKDLVKLQRSDIRGTPIWALSIDLQFVAGQEALEAKVAATLAARNE